MRNLNMPNNFKTKVLLVEDNSIVRMATMCIIEDVGFCDVESAENGEVAVELLLKKSYDLILMDLGLGEGLDGFQVTQKIRYESNLNKMTPIVALTAHSKAEVQEKCFQVGMQEVLCKPLEAENFKALVQKYIITL
jgi:CheY-like chemotaxis protein